MNCPVCENNIQKTWKYCPECGIKMEEGALSLKGYNLDHIRALWVEKGGDSFYKNFNSVQVLGISPFRKIKPIRPILGDYVDIHISNLRVFAMLSLQPNLMGDYGEINRLLGYYSADIAYKTTKLSRIVDLISKTEFYWKLLANKDIQRMLEVGWAENNQATLKHQTTDRKKQEVIYELEDGQITYLEKGKPLNFIDLNILAGNLEATCNRRFIGEETLKDGKTIFTYKVKPLKDKTQQTQMNITKEEAEQITDTLVDNIVNSRQSGRKLKDLMHISGEQVDTYYIIKTSEGHKILEKYAGVKSGRKIAEKAKIQGEEEAIEYIKKLFKQERIGLIHQPTKHEDRITITMTESAFSSGVENIQMKLDLFPAGLIEGILSQATEKKWTIEETRCIANGEDYCEFQCRI